MANPVTTGDLEARWRPLTQQEEANGQAALDDAWAVLLFYAPTVDAQIAAGTLSTDLVKAIVCAMVLRAIRNPDGARNRSVSIDDYTETITLDSAVSTGALYLSEEELNWLGGTRRRSGSFMMGSYTPASATASNPAPDGWLY
jgi:hypothetical protein